MGEVREWLLSRWRAAAQDAGAIFLNCEERIRQSRLIVQQSHVNGCGLGPVIRRHRQDIGSVGGIGVKQFGIFNLQSSDQPLIAEQTLALEDFVDCFCDTLALAARRNVPVAPNLGDYLPVSRLKMVVINITVGLPVGQEALGLIIVDDIIPIVLTWKTKTIGTAKFQFTGNTYNLNEARIGFMHRIGVSGWTSDGISYLYRHVV